MGINICCVEKSVMCSYITWHRIRMALAKAVLKYVQEQIDRINREIERLDSHKTEEIIKKTQEKQLFNITDGFEIDDNLSFDDYLSMFEKHYDILKCYRIGGIYVLMVVPDTEGIYSAGNSFDIIDMIKVIQPYISENLPFLPIVIETFGESIEQHAYVTVD